MRVFVFAAGLAAGFAAAGVAPAFLTGAAGARQVAAPRTLLVAQKRVDAFAQDGGRIAWASDCKVRLGALPASKRTLLGNTGGSYCFEPASWSLALAGKRAVWGGYLKTASNNRYGTIYTAAPGSKQRDLEDLEQVEREWGAFLVGAAGDGATLVYSSTYVREFNGPDCPPCSLHVTGFPVRAVVGGVRRSLVGTPPAAAIAASSGRIAVVPADRSEIKGCCAGVEPHPVPNDPVQIRSARTGALIAKFTPRGTVLDVALSATTAAVITQDVGTRRIERFSAATGAPIRSTGVAGAPVDLSAAGGTVVYRVGRTILSLTGASDVQQHVATAAGTPIGLSIESRRVAWAENVRIGGRIRGRVRAVTI